MDLRHGRWRPRGGFVGLTTSLKDRHDQIAPLSRSVAQRRPLGRRSPFRVGPTAPKSRRRDRSHRAASPADFEKRRLEGYDSCTRSRSRSFTPSMFMARSAPRPGRWGASQPYVSQTASMTSLASSFSNSCAGHWPRQTSATLVPSLGLNIAPRAVARFREHRSDVRLRSRRCTMTTCFDRCMNANATLPSPRPQRSTERHTQAALKNSGPHDEALQGAGAVIALKSA